MIEQWVTAQIKQKWDSKCISWKNLNDLILAHPDTKKRVDVFVLSIYGLVDFPKALGHVDEVITNLFDRLDRRVTLVPAILAETFRSLKACRKAGEATPGKDDISEGKWMAILQNLQEEDIEWRAPWLLLDEILYQCEDFDWVPLLGIWKAVGYTLLLTRQMKSLAVGPMTTPEYNEWWVKRINDNVPRSSSENSQSIEEHLWVVPSELEIIKQDFERRNVELEKKIEQIEEEKMNFRLDVDVQKLKVEKLRKGKTKAEEDLDDLKTDYKKLRLSMRTDGLGKTLEQWHEKIQEERNKPD
ncbi:hypothetical protein Gotur_009974 [Gossypium turneri]